MVKILISPDETVDLSTHRPYLMVKRSYSIAVAEAGAVPLMAADARLFREYAKMADGLLLTDGSEPVNPARYGVPLSGRYAGKDWYGFGISYTRDSMDLTLCRAFLKEGKPVFGIGRGMHIINVAFGGTLTEEAADGYQRAHEPGVPYEIHFKSNVDTAIDVDASLSNGSSDGRSTGPSFADQFFSDLKGKSFQVRTFNRQYIDRVGAELVVAAYSDNKSAAGPDVPICGNAPSDRSPVSDGKSKARGRTVEAICGKDMPVLGVQWNPEAGSDDIEHYYAHALRQGEIPASPKRKEEFREAITRMHPVADVPTDADCRRETNVLFRRFVSWCGGR